MHKKQLEEIAKGFKERLWDRNHRLQAAHVVASVANETNPLFDSMKFFEACGLVDRGEAA